MNLAILTNGGDTCALNASIEAIRKVALKCGYGKIFGIKGGYHGLLHDKYQILNHAIDENTGGSFLGSFRESPCTKVDDEWVIDPVRVQKMVDCLQRLEVDVLVVIGGDGSLLATKKFHQEAQDRYRFRILGFPKTIDNDIRTHTTFDGHEVSLCPGFPTAALKIAQATRDIRTTAISAHRVFCVETMGRDAGWLAAAASLGGPDMILIPEVHVDKRRKELMLDRTKIFFQQSQSVVIVVSEGIKWTDEHGQETQVKILKYGPRKLGGVVDKVAEYIQERLGDERKEGKFLTADDEFGVRFHHTDYVPRSGPPCAYDQKLVKVLAQRLGILLDTQDWGKVPVLTKAVMYDDLHVDFTGARSIDEIEPKKFPDKDYYDKDRLITNRWCIDFLRTVTSGPSLNGFDSSGKS